MKTDMKQYELTFILGEKATPEEGTAKTKSIKELIKKLGGTVTKEELWGRRELAYEIKRNRSGFYVTLWMDLPSGKILNDMEQMLRFDEDVIRFLTTRAYTSAQPGTLYPAAEAEEAEQRANRGREQVEEKGSAEETLRRSSKPAKADAKAKVEEAADDLPEEERLEKLDEALEELLKEEE